MAKEEVPKIAPSAPQELATKPSVPEGIFMALDPQGYTIILDRERWEHIISGHREMEELKDAIELTIKAPELITRDSAVSETHYYYRLTGRSIFRRDDIYVNVVVSRDERTKTGFVKTAFLVKTIRKNGDMIWLNRK